MSLLPDLRADIERGSELLLQTLAQGCKIILCGNGGSAADCQHIAAELVVSLVRQRPGLPAVALTTDAAILTAQANDVGYDTVFERQVQALGRPGDCLVAISTSGNSANVVRAAQAARRQQIVVVALTGKHGGQLVTQADWSIRVPAENTARVQEAHLLIAHYWCGVLEDSVC